MDGRKVRVTNEPGEIVKPDQIKTIVDQGMPFFKKSYKYGNLFIQFKIKFPDKLDQPRIDLLSKALKDGKGKKEESKEEVEEKVKMIAFNEAHKNTHVGGGDRGNDSEEEEDDEGMHG